MQFKITYADGKVVDAEGGKLSSNGLYTTNKEGHIILSGITGTIINVTFEIRRASDGGLVDTVTTGKDGRVFVTLEAGSFYAVETDCPKEYKLDSTPHYFEVKAGKATPPLVVANKAFSGILLHLRHEVA